MGEPAGGSEVSEGMVVDSVGGFAEAKFQCQDFQAGAKESASNG